MTPITWCTKSGLRARRSTGSSRKKTIRGWPFLTAPSLVKKRNEWVEQSGITGARFYSRIEPEDDAHAFHTMNIQIRAALKRIREKFDCEVAYAVFLTGAGNFREQVATIQPYKGNRKAAKPVLYDKLRDFLVDNHDAIVVTGQEADDEVAIRQTMAQEGVELDRDNPQSVIVTIDKDLLQVPGWHYNPQRDGFKFVTPEFGALHFYRQILTGDAVDNIPGIKGMGPKKAEKILQIGMTPGEMWHYCLDEYESCGQYDDPTLAAIENAQLLWMKRSYDEALWPPEELWTDPW